MSKLHLCIVEAYVCFRLEWAREIYWVKFSFCGLRWKASVMPRSTSHLKRWNGQACRRQCLDMRSYVWIRLKGTKGRGRREWRIETASTCIHSNSRMGPPERAETASESRKKEPGLWYCPRRSWLDQGWTMNCERNEVCLCREPQPGGDVYSSIPLEGPKKWNRLEKCQLRGWYIRGLLGVFGTKSWEFEPRTGPLIWGALEEIVSPDVHITFCF